MATPSPVALAYVSQSTFDPHSLATETPPPPPLLSPQQLTQCSVALSIFKEMLGDEEQKMISHFKEIQTFCLSSPRSGTMAKMRCLDAVSVHNSKKNRYPRVLPYDGTRVILNASDDSKGERNNYINASFVSAGAIGKVSQFIATQGPIPNTFDDFWQMIYQYRCSVIVMLTQFDNAEITKQCDNYFKSEKEQGQFGNIRVETKSTVKTNSSLVLRCLELQRNDAMEPPVHVLHIEYREWPDEGVPRCTVAVRDILRRLYNVPTDAGSIVVHCSAGIGRTGTYCTIHNTIQRILLGDTFSLNVLKTISDFRSQRMGLVQKEDQFKFCYQAMIDELEELILSSTDKIK